MHVHHDKITLTPRHVFAWTMFPHSMEYTRLMWKHVWKNTAHANLQVCCSVAVKVTKKLSNTTAASSRLVNYHVSNALIVRTINLRYSSF